MLPRFPDGGSAGTVVVGGPAVRGGVLRPCVVSSSGDDDFSTITLAGRSSGLSPLGSEVDEEDGSGLDLRFISVGCA